jgi:Cu+-exporting ATPase
LTFQLLEAPHTFQFTGIRVENAMLTEANRAMNVAGAGAELKHVILPIEGMRCATCAGRIEKALSALPGVQATVNLAGEQADIAFDPGRLDGRVLAQVVEHAGYKIPYEARELAISGMTCATCASRIEAALKRVSGVTRAEVNLANEKASVEGITGLLRPADLIAAVRQADYDAQLLTGDRRDKVIVLADQRRLRRERWRIIAAAALSAPLLLPMFGMMLPGWVQFLLATPVQFIIGWRFYVGAWKALRARTGNMDLLVSLGTSAAYFYSVYLMFAGPPGTHLYFEAAAVVITLIMVGRWLEVRAKRSTTAAIRALMSLRPERARRYRVRSGRTHRLADQSRLCADPSSDHLSWIDRTRPVSQARAARRGTWIAFGYRFYGLGKCHDP